MTRSTTPAPTAFDWLMIGLSTLLVGGLLLLSYAASHDALDNVLLTVWHAPLYLGMLATAYVAGTIGLGRRRTDDPRRPLRLGYEYVPLATTAFFVAFIGDYVLHAVAGPEFGLAEIVSPLHFAAYASVAVIVLSPLRALRVRGARPGPPSVRLAMALPLALLLALFGWVTQFANPLSDVRAGPTGVEEFVRSDIYTIGADGAGQTRLLTSADAALNEPSAASDGERLVFVEWRLLPSGEFVSDVVLHDRASGLSQNLTAGDVLQGRPFLSPDGERIAFSRVTEDAPTGTPPPPCPEGEEPGPEANCVPSGPLPGLRPGSWDVFVMDAEGGNVIRLTDNPSYDIVGGWSPDGSQILFHSDSDGDGEIYVMNADGSGVEQLTDNEAEDWYPTWSADEQIAFHSNRDGNFEVYVMNGDGSAQTRWTDDPEESLYASLSPDGDALVFATDGDGAAQDLYLLEAPMGEPTNLTHTPGLHEFTAVWLDDETLLYDAAPVIEGGEDDEILGVASVALQSAIIAGIVLYALGAGAAALGTFAVVLGLAGAALSVMSDRYEFVAIGFVAGIATDAVLQLAARRGLGAWSSLAVGVAAPLVFFTLYFLVVAVTTGVGWSGYLIAGSLVLAAAIGALVGFFAQTLSVRRPTAD